MLKMSHIMKYFLLGFTSLLLTSCGIHKSINNRPDVATYSTDISEKITINDSTFIAGNSFLTKNNQGLWELYVEGNPLQLGLVTGNLTQHLMYKQEQVFFDRVNALVPSQGRQKFLRKFLSWYNRKMYTYVPEPYKAEIYGLSQYASTDFNSIATPYLRGLYLHGTHDIGHALRDLALVGCTSFAAWDDKTEDGNLLIGRNFDFYAGDAFAEDKIIAFINPSEGHKFMSVTWGGFMGVVSGMNDKGLTVTINAGKSKIPLMAKTPISIVAREILQFASNINEAVAIAKKREVFVSEAIMVGSAADNKAVLIEVAPKKFGVYEVENSNELICSNHFQSEPFAGDRRNMKTIEESHSQYRYERMEELLTEHNQINPTDAVSILRNKDGLEDAILGYGNEKAINQLLAHHGVVFKPATLQVWVSSNPYQLGEFVAYDLNTVFDNRQGNPSNISVSNSNLNIAEDPFVHSDDFKKYEAYRVLESQIERAIKDGKTIVQENLYKLTAYNADYWKAHYLVGNYHYGQKQFDKALENFKKASTKEITTAIDEEKLHKLIKKSTRKANQ